MAFKTAEAQEEGGPVKTKEIGTFLIRIIEQAGVYPKEAKIKPGTTVIWVNTTDDFVEIFFTGKQVEVACKSPVHFIINPKEGGFFSDKIPPGAVASLCFMEKGNYDYTVTPARLIYRPPIPKIRESKGTIIVE